ncbi:hypothetical protein [Teichococcus oryzae]|uniref:DUF4168 domain-containing protein n=1 Tax=Teichococcus oryzae TaxID=1608942 RepID=A0A5B2TI09_9PROT|nr:hypothetical protein [Pseudoroseomonas oryzae]KAA2213420.1 hypothetical protein F0Q34_09250 [Pseudoroseomonas oryzae]
MLMRNSALVLLLSLPLAAPAWSQGTLGQEVAPNQTQGETSKTRPDQFRDEAPQQALDSLQEYARVLGEARGRLEAALGRSGEQPPANQQNAMTPAWMDLKTAAQNAYQTVRRAPGGFRGEATYSDAERQLRQELNAIDQATGPANISGPVRNMLSQLERLQQEVGRRAG